MPARLKPRQRESFEDFGFSPPRPFLLAKQKEAKGSSVATGMTMVGIPRIHPLPQLGMGLSSILPTKQLCSPKHISQLFFKLPLKATECHTFHSEM